MIDTKRFIQYAWVFETIFVILLTAIFILWFPAVVAPLWLQALPLLTALIGGQGAAASVGPALVKMTQVKYGESEKSPDINSKVGG